MATFNEKVIIVTGASEGIGRGLCLALADQKPRIVLIAKNQDRLNQLKEEAESKGVKALVLPTDISEEAACQKLIEDTVAEWGRIDALVNNAGSKKLFLDFTTFFRQNSKFRCQLGIKGRPPIGRHLFHDHMNA